MDGMKTNIRNLLRILSLTLGVALMAALANAQPTATAANKNPEKSKETKTSEEKKSAKTAKAKKTET
jgi:hypothetical protein